MVTAGPHQRGPPSPTSIADPWSVIVAAACADSGAANSNYHRTLATYLNTLIQGGFTIEEISEPEATPLLADQQPVYTSVPIFLGVRAVASTSAMSR